MKYQDNLETLQWFYGHWHDNIKKFRSGQQNLFRQDDLTAVQHSNTMKSIAEKSSRNVSPVNPQRNASKTPEPKDEEKQSSGESPRRESVVQDMPSWLIRKKPPPSYLKEPQKMHTIVRMDENGMIG